MIVLNFDGYPYIEILLTKTNYNMVYLEILIAAVAAFLLGFLWYTALFGKIWQAETGITDEVAKKGIALTHGLAFLMMVAIAFFLSKYAELHPDEDKNFLHGAFHAGQACLKYALPVMAIHYLYQKKSIKLYLIDALYILAIFALMGGILYGLRLAG